MITALMPQVDFSSQNQADENKKDIYFGKMLTPEQWARMRANASTIDSAREKKLTIWGGSLFAGGFIATLLDSFVCGKLNKEDQIYGLFAGVACLLVMALGAGVLYLSTKKSRIISFR